MRHNLGQVIQCVSHVSTRLRCAHKSVANSGSPTKVVIQQLYIEQLRYVTNVSTDLNVLNGVSIMSDTESGAVLLRVRESEYAVKEE